MSTLHDIALSDLVATNSAAARVLDRYGLDYCCHGRRTLRDACESAALAVDDVVAELSESEPGTPAWMDLSLADLADHIVATHHAYLHTELPLLDALAAKVASVHGGRHPELNEVRRLVAEIRADLEPHLLKEERILFPAIGALTGGQRDFPFGTIANPVRMMLVEHDRTGELLSELRETSGGFAVPDDGCASYRSLYERLAALEHDTHVHVHKENHVLFPAAVALYDADHPRTAKPLVDQA